MQTKPSQVLDKNHGLRDLCPSVTGGSVIAQGIYFPDEQSRPRALIRLSGYWMPYACAKALCSTFCYEIAGALIPIFGPRFPMECLRPSSPRFGDMTITQELIADAARGVGTGRNTPLPHSQPCKNKSDIRAFETGRQCQCQQDTRHSCTVGGDLRRDKRPHADTVLDIKDAPHHKWCSYAVCPRGELALCSDWQQNADKEETCGFIRERTPPQHEPSDEGVKRRRIEKESGWLTMTKEPPRANPTQKATEQERLSLSPVQETDCKCRRTIKRRLSI